MPHASEYPSIDTEQQKASSLRKTVTGCLVAVVTVILFVLHLIDQQKSQESRIAEWAIQHGYTVAGEVQRPGFLEPTPFWLTGEHDAVLKVALADREERKRTSWFRFGLFGVDQAWKD